MYRNALLIGPLPKGKATGVSLGFQSLIEGYKEKDIPYTYVDLLIGGNVKKSGTFNIKRAYFSIYAVILSWYKTLSCHTLYMTISSSRYGFCRDFLIIAFAILLSKRIILHLKGGGYKEFYNAQPSYFKLIIKNTLKRVTHIVALGELLKEQFDFIPNIDKLIKVIPNGEPYNCSHNISTPKTFPSKDTSLRILYLSNLVPSKGYLDLLEACKLLKHKEKINFRCDYCGEFLTPVTEAGNKSKELLEKEFKEKVTQYGLSDNVFFNGTITGKEKEDFLKNAHCFVLPTYYPWEGQPISIIEAMTYSVPILSTKHKGIPEELIDGYNGYFIDKNSPESIVEQIKKLINNVDAYQLISQNSREHYKKNFTREIHLKRLISLISPSQ